MATRLRAQLAARVQRGRESSAVPSQRSACATSIARKGTANIPVLKSPSHQRSPETISRNMAAVHARDGKAERALRSILWRRGLRFRVCRHDLPGKPDLVFARARMAVFVDGDFWHARLLVEHGPEALRASFRTSRAAWWIAKLTRNSERDQEVTAALRQAGWKVTRLWERDILRDPQRAADKIEAILRRALTSDRATGASTPIPPRRHDSGARRRR
jgi:DNA mismatch endonuclease (patch repair protein)